MEDENFSSFEILHPSTLVQPVVYFLVVTRGPQVGIFGAMECKEVELVRLLSGREYAFRDFEDWRSAFRHYKKSFESDDVHIVGSGSIALCEGFHPNSSGRYLPHPDDMVEPERSFLVVTRGHKVGIFDEPGQIDLQRLFSTPGYALRHFSYWKPAYRYYKACFNKDDLALTARRKKRQRSISTDFTKYTDYISDCDIIPAKSDGQQKRAKSGGESSSGAQTRVVRPESKRDEYNIAVFGSAVASPKGGTPFRLDRLPIVVENVASSENMASSSKLDD